MRDLPIILKKFIFHADFNQDELTPLLSRKFSRIVIDLSVKKFLGNDFTKRFRQMLRDSTSELIFPADGAYCVYKNPEYYPEIGDKEFIYCVASDIFYLNLKHSKEIQTELSGKVRLKEMECQMQRICLTVSSILTKEIIPISLGGQGQKSINSFKKVILTPAILN